MPSVHSIFTCNVYHIQSQLLWSNRRQSSEKTHLLKKHIYVKILQDIKIGCCHRRLRNSSGSILLVGKELQLLSTKKDNYYV